MSASPPPRKHAKVQARSLSASEIARNPKYFDTWSTYQGCESVAFSDLPTEFHDSVDQIFDLTGMLPRAWVDPMSSYQAKLAESCSPEFIHFLKLSYDSSPGLFTDAVDVESNSRLLDTIRCAFLAWGRLHKLRASEAKISEAVMVANVYEVLRSPAAETSSYRSKCSLSLAKPLPHIQISSESLRILSASTIIPDAALFIPFAQIRDLSYTAASPFKTLKKNPLTGKPGRSESSFASHCTPCSQLPNMPCFEFASSFWEDKKPVQLMLEDAYRQNRMSTTAAVRHLHSLHIHAPVIGLVWADGTVRAHVDWCVGGWDESITIHSAPYPGTHDRPDVKFFHEWSIDDAGDALKVFLLVRNIDAYTTGEFTDKVYEGIKHLERSVESGARYRPWKRVGALSVTPLRELRSFGNVSTSASAESTPESEPKQPKPKYSRRRAARVSHSPSC